MTVRKTVAHPKAKTTPRTRTRKTPVRSASVKKQEPSFVAPAPRTVRAVHHTYKVAVGRRKSAIARIRYTDKGNGLFLVNGQEVSTYFPTFEMKKIVNDPFEVTQFSLTGDVSVKVAGGGKHGQSEAVRLGTSRLLVLLNPEYRTVLKKAGFMTRDPRVKERKKYGLKRARRAPQWQKR